MRVFQYKESMKNWTEVGQTLHDEDLGDNFGALVALSVDERIVAMAAKYKDLGN